MVKMNLKCLPGLKTKITHEPSGATFHTAAPVDNNGDGSSFSPTDMLASATLSCMVTIMAIVANTHHFSIEGTAGSVEKHMGSNPRRVAKLVITIDIPTNLSEDQKQLLKTGALNCPVAKSLDPDIDLAVTFNFGK